MKQLFAVLSWALAVNPFAAQMVEGLVEFEITASTASNHRVLIDASEDYVLLLVHASGFSTSNGFTFQDPEARGVLLFCDPMLNVLWHTSFQTGFLKDAALASDGVYIFAEGTNGLLLPGGGTTPGGSTTITKLDFNGSLLWDKGYNGLSRLGRSDRRSLVVDGTGGVILASGLWNYEYSADIEPLVFLSDTCYCSAIDLQFPLCTTTLKWDSDGNEIAYHVLDSESPSTPMDVGADDFGNYYVSGWLQLFSLDLPLFGDHTVESGAFLLKFGVNDQQEWVYSLSDQAETNITSAGIRFISGDNTNVLIEVAHDSNEFVIDNQSFDLGQPAEGFFLYQTTHIVDAQTGEFDMLDFFSYLGVSTDLEQSADGQLYAMVKLPSGFTHSFPPYSFSAMDNGPIPILSKALLGQYDPLVLLDPISVLHLDKIGSEKMYLHLQSNTGPVAFGFGGETFTAQTDVCVAIVDKVSSNTEISSTDVSLSVYPNPSAERISVQAGFAIEHICIVNALGKVTLQHDVQPTRFMQLDHSLPPGYYVLHLFGSGARASTGLLVH